MSQIYGHKCEVNNLIDGVAFDSLITSDSTGSSGFNSCLVYVDLTWNAATAIRIRPEVSPNDTDWYPLQRQDHECPFQNTTGEGVITKLYDLEFERDVDASQVFAFTFPLSAPFVRLLVDGTDATGTDTVDVHIRLINNGPYGQYTA